jgi:hypothetical protein
MRRALEVLLLALFIVGCGTSQPGGQAQLSPRETPPEASPPAAVQGDFPQTLYNTVIGESPKYQATQTIGVESQQLITSTQYVMTVSISQWQP